MDIGAEGRIPMSFAIFKGEKTIKDLVARLFHVEGPDANSNAKQAEDSLVAANPQLANLQDLPVGSKIVVPATPLPVNTAEVSAGAAAATNVRVGLTLENLKAAVPSTLSAVTANANSTLALTQKPEVQAAAAKDPALAQRLADAANQAKQTLQLADARQQQLLQVVAQLQQQLAKFSKG
jgi:hypothetical protein